MKCMNNKRLLVLTLLLPLRCADAGRQQHLAAIKQLKLLVPPPERRELGGEGADDAAYARFLSVTDWDPAKAAPKLRSSLEWRRRVRPGSLRPRDCPTLCRQGAWVALLAAGARGTATPPDGGDEPPPGRRERTKRRVRSWMRGSSCDADDDPLGRRRRAAAPLDTPHNCPPLRSWRSTRHGLPITYFRCWMWRPDKTSAEEIERHMAYHMHHLIRRTRRNVSRVCIIFDMQGFEGWMLPYIHQGINILRLHYPGRAGAMCFINVPGYFHTVWKIISPWLDDEIRSKTFFAPTKVDDVEKVIAFLNKMNLKIGPA